jgi:hypothetical protein
MQIVIVTPPKKILSLFFFLEQVGELCIFCIKKKNKKGVEPMYNTPK